MSIRTRAAAVVRAALQMPPTAGDVAQVADLPPDVQAAFGVAPGEFSRITRRQAMAVPAFARGRNTIVGTVAALDLNAVRGDGTQSRRPLLDQPDPAATRLHTLAWTVDDLLCEGIAWWHVIERDGSGWATRARRVHPSRVTLDSGRAWVNGSPVDPGDLVRFDSIHEGVLDYGAPTLRAALALERAVARYADTPEPNAVLFDKRPLDADVPELSDTAVDALLSRWSDRGKNRSTRWLNRAVGYERLTFTPTELDLTAARQQAAVQVGRMLNMPSRGVNAPSESSMTYSTTAGDRQEVIDTTVATYLTAIEQRLSMDDVTPRGQRVQFDRQAYVAGTITERIANARSASESGLMSVDEARRIYLGLPPLTASTSEVPTP